MLLLSRTLYEANIPTICRCASIRLRFLTNARQFKHSLYFAKPSHMMHHNDVCSPKVSGVLKCPKGVAFVPAVLVSGVDNKCSLTTKRMFSTCLVHRTGDGKPNAETRVEMKETSKWFTIPNALTLFRMGVSPYLGYLVVSQNFTWALGLFMLAGLTDSMDGWIARNVEGQASIIGSYIDPLADKILISILTLSLTMVDIIPVLLCGMIILRDVLLVATSSHFHYKNLPPPKTLQKFLDFENSPVKMEPTQISKYNTFLQLGLVTISIAAPIFGFVDHSLLHAYWYLVGTTTVVSGCSYFVKDKSAYKR